MRILEISDPAAVQRHSQRNDEVGELLRHLLAAGDPDALFQESVRPMFRGFKLAVRRRSIKKLATAFGVDREVMKAYLLAAGLVNNRD